MKHPLTTTETIVDAFERAAREYAGREAISDNVTTLTYAELAARSGRIARALRDRGLAPGDRVGVHIDRGPATYQLFLGVLGAGLVVVPFNPTHPPEHKARMVEAAEPAVTVTDTTDAP
ncbi:AMP-binding protein, partial [Nocardia gipuzkoensis]